MSTSDTDAIIDSNPGTVSNNTKFYISLSVIGVFLALALVGWLLYGKRSSVKRRQIYDVVEEIQMEIFLYDSVR